MIISFFKNLYYPSQLLTDSELEVMCKGGTVLEQDERGIKVILLSSGDILKIFRIRNRFSGTRIFSHARRFCRNALRLQSLNIPTVRLKSLFHLETDGQTAVLYEPLAGESIRGLVKKDIKKLDQTEGIFGHFLANLHSNGVHFHSLHTGNILLLPNGEFGLIDISDMSIYPWALTCNTRLRSFLRLCNYSGDIQALGEGYWNKVLESYIRLSSLSSACKQRILNFRPTKKLIN
jgi:tRNA A-37 threonylcarbamoyl transferase component Bud32